MKLLLDANLSWRLVRALSSSFPKINHINELLPQPAKDIAIWNLAFQEDYIIVTNDEDFLNLLLNRGFPPKIILLKTGNQSNFYLINLLIKNKSAIEGLYSSKEFGILELL
jgi:predicted nuclease of predicted toxin-antitoxin system